MVSRWWGNFVKCTKVSRPSRRLAKMPRTFRMWLERLEDRTVPASLDITTGSLLYTATAGFDNDLSIGVASGDYSFTDTGETITVTTNAMAAGWTGSGTNTVVGPASSVTTDFTVDLKDGADELNVNGAIDVAGAVSLQSGQDITLNGNITTSGNITLQAGGNITEPGSSTVATGQTIIATAAGNLNINALDGVTVSLTSNASSIDSTGSLAVQASGGLTVDAATGITLNTLANDLEANNSTSGNISITQLNSSALTLTVTGNGVVNDAATGTINLTNLGDSIAVNAPIETTGNGAITLAAFDFQINGDINSGTGRTSLVNSIAGTQIDLGTNTTGDIGLTNAELADVTAGVLQIGSLTAGSINVSAGISAPAGWSILILINGDTITEAPAGSLTVANLCVLSAGPVTLSGTNDVGNLATSTTNAFLLDNGSNSLTVPSGGVAGTQGIFATDGDVTLGGDNIDLPASSVITSTTGTVTLIAGVSGTDPNALLALLGTITGVNITLDAPSSITVNVLTATGTITFNSTGGSVDSSGSEAVQANDLTLSAATGVTLNTQVNNLEASNSTSGNINITQLGAPAQTVTINGNGVVNDAASGTISITNLRASIAISSGTDVDTTGNGDITLAALDFQIAGDINSGTGRTSLTSSSAGSQIDIGTNTPGDIGLTNADLGFITAGVLQIGSPTAGSINISAAISAPAGWSTLTLINNDTITEATAGSLTVTNLRIISSGPVTLGSDNSVGNLSSSTTNAFLLDNGTNSLTIPSAGVDGVLGISTNNGDITLVADNIVIDQVIAPGTGTVILEPSTQALNMTVGTASVAGTSFGFTNAELGWITTGVTQVGATADTGNIVVTAAIDENPTGTAPSRSQTLSLDTSGSISDNSGVGQIAVQNLALQAANDSGNFAAALVNSNNAVANLAASVSNGDFTFVNGASLTVGGPIAGLTGITDTTGSVYLSAAIIKLAAVVSSGGGQTYNDAVTLAGNIMLVSNEQGDITFASTVDSPGTAFILTIDTMGLITFDGAVGGDSNPLASLITGPPGTPILINGGSVQTTGTQNYGGNVTTALGTTTLTSTGNQAIIFGGNIAPAQPGTKGTIALSTTFVTTLTSLNTFIVGLAGPAASSELLNVAGGGGIDLGGAVLQPEVFASVLGSSYTIVSSPVGGITGTFAGLVNGAVLVAGGHTFRISYTATAVTLVDLGISPAITSPADATFTAGTAESFTVFATGLPTPIFSLNGAPNWLTIGVSSGQLTGTPPNLGAGPYTFNFTITASNGVNPTAMQQFTLTVNQSPGITSANHTTFVIEGGVFTVQTTGFPIPVLTETGLPEGLDFFNYGVNDGLYGYAALEGTPATYGVFPITITASNGVSPNATQHFTLTVSGIPSFATTPNQRFIAQAYLDLFHQIVDTGGLAYWSSLVDQGVSRSTVVLAIERDGTNQFQTEEVEQIYQRFLHRLADSAGLQSGVAFLNHGGTVQQLSAIFMGSPEFYLTQGGGSNQGFLEAMYQDGLLRPIDPNALAVDLLYLAQGGSRTDLATEVSTSQEADAILVEDAYNAFLGRVADPEGLAAFTQSLENGASFEQVVAALMGSPEYQQNRVGD